MDDRERTDALSNSPIYRILEGSKVHQSVIHAYVVTKQYGRYVKPEHKIHH
jgi:hypothetical protein